MRADAGLSGPEKAGEGRAGKRQDGIRTVEDLRLRCRIDDLTGCWVWAGARNGPASARVWMPGIQGPRSLAWALQFVQYGTIPTAARQLVPRCGESCCANPAHRAWGTRGDLFRAVMPPRTTLHRAKLAAAKRASSKVMTAELAEEIRTSSESAKSIADRTGVAVTHVCSIRRGKSWAPLARGASVFGWGGAA